MEITSDNHQRKILIVDDSTTIRYLLRLTLSDPRFILFEADSSEKALPIIKNESPELIVLDVMMPGDMNGFQLCQMIKAWPNAQQYKIILLTACTQQDDLEQGQQAGADYYLTKPFSPIDLMGIIHQILPNQ